jgi:hypothetical protein
MEPSADPSPACPSGETTLSADLLTVTTTPQSTTITLLNGSKELLTLTVTTGSVLPVSSWGIWRPVESQVDLTAPPVLTGKSWTLTIQLGKPTGLGDWYRCKACDRSGPLDYVAHDLTECKL